MGEVLKKFGRYFLLDHVAQGGMAEIYRARLASHDGAGRLLVIKRIQAGFGTNVEFLQMFKSEIKVTMGFNHPNIVQLYDFGEEQEQPFIAMEFVDGKNLRQFLHRFNELKQTFPVDLAAYIIEQAASGLHYAHTFKDKISGQALNIVHRDISPQNILISFEGNIKVIDFGIAKASTNSESTRAGVIKGKPSYLSPEQITGETLDGRCDIFALGIVLWELLTGKKLFAGDNDLAVLKLIESCTTHVKPPSTINPKIPKELDYIVLKSLAKNREKRYQTADEMQRALHKFIYAYSPDFNPSDLAYYAKDLFKNEIVEDRKKIQKLNEKAEKLLVSASPEERSGISIAKEYTEKKPEESTAVTSIDSKPERPRASHEVFDAGNAKGVQVEFEAGRGSQSIKTGSQTAFSPSASPVAPSPAFQSPQPSAPAAPAQRPMRSAAPAAAPAKKSQNNPKRTALIAAAALVGVVLYLPDLGIEVPFVSEMLKAETKPATTETTLVLQGQATGVNVTLNGQTVATALPAAISKLRHGVPFQLQVTGEHGTFEESVTLAAGERKVVQVKLGGSTAVADPSQVAHTSADPQSGETPVSGEQRQVANLKTILLKVHFSSLGASRAFATINGKPLSPENPMIEVPLDSPLELIAEKPGFRTLRREFFLDSRQYQGQKETALDVALEPTSYGFLTVRTTPSAEATIVVDGKPWVKKTPIDNEKIPSGTYTLRLTNKLLGMEKTVTTTVKEGKAVVIDTRLEVRD